MAFEIINPLAELWRTKGLKYLYYPQGCPAEKQQVNISQSKNAPSVPTHESGPRVTNPKSSRQAQVAKSKPESAKPAGFNFVSFDQWPAHLQEYYQTRSRQGNIGWTYLELGHDIVSARIVPIQEEKEKMATRRNFLQKIIGDLNFKASIHTFWPIYLPNENRPQCEEDIDIFWSAMRLLKCRAVVILGTDAASFLLKINNIQTLRQIQFNPFFVWIMHDINYLARSDDQYANICAYLQQSLKRFTR